MLCPRCHVELFPETHQGIEVDHCPSCNGRWFDHHELDHLEDTAFPAHEVKGTRRYAVRQSELKCPKCQGPMKAFNYRAYNLELDACEAEDGFWLDAGEESRVRDIMEERLRGLERSRSAEQAWGKFMGRLKSPSFIDRLLGRK